MSSMAVEYRGISSTVLACCSKTEKAKEDTRDAKRITKRQFPCRPHFKALSRNLNPIQARLISSAFCLNVQNFSLKSTFQSVQVDIRQKKGEQALLSGPDSFHYFLFTFPFTFAFAFH